MVEIVLRSGSRQEVLELVCSGHAEFSDDEHGGDIVCAAVSALTGYLGITLSDVLGWPDAVSGSDGSFCYRRPGDEEVASRGEILDVLLEGWLRSVRALEENYSGWVKVVEVPFGSAAGIGQNPSGPDSVGLRS